MPSTDRASDHALGPATSRSRAVRRPAPVLRWLAAGVVAFPQAWTLAALAVGTIGLAAWGFVEVVVVLAVAVLVGLGHRWAYAAVVVLGVAAFVAGTVDPGMLALAFWVFGVLYAAIGIALLLASRVRTPTR